MTTRYTLFLRGSTFYCEDSLTKKQMSLRTRDRAEAQTLLAARNEAARQPFLNLRLAQTYLAASDSEADASCVGAWTWQPEHVGVRRAA